MKYLTDEHIPLLLAQLLRAAGIDVRTAQECGLLGRPDEELLAFAAQEGRCLVTANFEDFPGLTQTFAEYGRPHAGVVCATTPLYTSDSPWVSAALIRLHTEFPEGAYPYFLYWLSKSRNS